MAMNREQKRLLQKQKYLDKDGEAIVAPRGRGQSVPPAERTSPRQFLSEVRSELRKVVWPSRSEVVNYSAVVLVFLVIITAMVAALDWGFARAVLWLYGVN